MIPADFLGLLRCPLTGQTLEPADAVVLARLQAGNHPLEEALIRSDRQVAYPVRAGIPVLLAEEAITL